MSRCLDLQPPLVPGQMMISPLPQLGQYRLLRRIGVGGMAEVYEAELVTTDGFTKPVAVKVLLPHCQRDPELVKAFVDEARIAAQLSHANIVTVYDFGEVDRLYYLAMEYVDGWDLDHLIHCSRLAQQPIYVAEAAYIGHELSQALHYIHTRESLVVHRDITPHNVFVARGGHIKLGDFGVAKAAERLARTMQGQIKGKLPYLAPEQVRGDPVDQRTDVYGAGLILFELVTGRRYNAGENEADALANVMNPEPIRASSLAPQAAPLDEVIAGALEPHPAMRTRDAGLLADQLADILSAHPCDALKLAKLAAELSHAGPRAQRDRDDPPSLAGHPTGTSKTGVADRDRTYKRISPSTQQSRPPKLGSPPRRRWPVWALAGLLVAGLGAGIFALTARRTPERSAIPGTDAGLAPAARTSPADAALPLPNADATTTAIPDVATLPDVTTAPAKPLQAPRSRAQRRLPRRKHVDTRQSRRARPGRPQPVSNATDQVDADSSSAGRRQTLGRLAMRAKDKGLWSGDDATFDGLYRRAWRAVAQGKGNAELRQLARYVDAFQIDERFIKGKLGKLERAIERASVGPTRRQQLSVESQRILQLVLAEQLVAASRRITALRHELRRPTR